MNKKYFWISITVLITLFIISGLYLGYQYWQKGTPEYSFKQIQKAFTDHDTTALSQYYDVNAIANNIWPRYQAHYIESYSQESTLVQALDTATLNNQENVFKNGFKQGTYDAVLGKNYSGESTEFKEGPLKFILNSPNPIFSIKDNNIATTDFIYQNYALKNPQDYPIYQFKLIMTKQNNHTWKMTDIQGYEDYFTQSLDDSIRQQDLNTIAGIIIKYINSGQKPFLDNNNWRSVLTDYLKQQGDYTSLPEDPLSSYGNKYLFSITNSDSLKYSYVLQAKLSTATYNLFQKDSTPVYKNLSYKSVINVISKNSNIILGIDCNVPANCNVGFGSNSDWVQLLK